MFLKATICSVVATGACIAAHGFSHGWIYLERATQEARLEAEEKIASWRGYVRPQAPAETLNVLELIEREALRNRISPALLRSLATVESGLDPYAVSSAGARGLLQVMPFWTKSCGLKNPAELFETEKNIACGAKILAQELKANGDDPVLALQAYNGGSRCIGKCAESIAHSKKVLKLASRDIR